MAGERPVSEFSCEPNFEAHSHLRLNTRSYEATTGRGRLNETSVLVTGRSGVQVSVDSKTTPTPFLVTYPGSPSALLTEERVS